MSTTAKLRGSDFDFMVQRGAFDSLSPMKIELIRGELRFMNPAGPIHEGEIQYLTEWSYASTSRDEISIRVQSGIQCTEHRPEPDLVWIRRLNSRNVRPNHLDVLLLIEVSDSSLTQDLGEKAELYAEHDIPEYWVVDINAECVHVHRNPVEGRYDSIEMHHKPTSISPLCRTWVRLDLAELFDMDS